jgi:hypothetical protein
MATTFFHDLYGGCQGDLGIGLIITKRNIHNYKASFPCTYHALGMVDHLVQRNGESGGMARHYITCTVTHQNNINTRTVE